MRAGAAIPALGFTEHAVPARVRALLSAHAPPRPAYAIAPLAMPTIGALALTDASCAFLHVRNAHRLTPTRQQSRKETTAT